MPSIYDDAIKARASDLRQQIKQMNAEREAAGLAPINDENLNTQDVAELMRFSRATVVALIKTGHIKAFTPTPGATKKPRYRVRLLEIARYIEGAGSTTNLSISP